MKPESRTCGNCKHCRHTGHGNLLCKWFNVAVMLDYEETVDYFTCGGRMWRPIRRGDAG